MTRRQRLANRPSIGLHGAIVVVLTIASGCTRAPAPPSDSMSASPEEEAAAVAAAAAGRIAVPSSVRTNLGITFAPVERRRVEPTLRIPGTFELVPSARRAYHTALAGRVEFAVEQFDEVQAGDLLFTIESPAWRDHQQLLVETKSIVDRAAAQLASFDERSAAHHEHERLLEAAEIVWQERLQQLEAAVDAGANRAQELMAARASLADVRTAQAEAREKEADFMVERSLRESEYEAGLRRHDLLLARAATIHGIDRPLLEEPTLGQPRWAVLDRIEVRAAAKGVVSAIDVTAGAWVDETAPVLTVIQPRRLRFHAEGLQSDLAAWRDGLPARIVPPSPTRAPGAAADLTSTMDGSLRLGVAANARARTIDLYVVPEDLADWARDGVAGLLEVVTDPSATPELAIPLAAVQRDGLVPVFFRRNPADPNTVIRTEADLGANDGRWVEVLSGLMDGDEIVLDGSFQLMLASGGQKQSGGHFHADGTFHEGDH